MRAISIIAVLCSVVSASPITYTLVGNIDYLYVDSKFINTDFAVGDEVTFSLLIDTDRSGVIDGIERPERDFFEVVSAPQLFVPNGVNPFFSTNTDNFNVDVASAYFAYGYYSISNPNNGYDNYLYQFQKSNIAQMDIGDVVYCLVSGQYLPGDLYPSALIRELLVTSITSAVSVPEPSTISLLFAGLCMLPLLRLRKRKSI